MMNLRLMFLCLLMLTGFAYPSHAQNDAVVQDKKVLNTPTDKELQNAIKEVHKEGKKSNDPKTGVEFANAHFMRCIAEKKPRYTAEVQEYLCGCTAAKIAEYLSVAEMKIMMEDSKKGEDARVKYMIHVYTPCMRDALDEITVNSCKDSAFLKKNVVLGKKKICDCMVSGMQSYVDASAPEIIMMAVTEDPMTIDPLHYLLGTESYTRRNAEYINNCYNANVTTK